MVENPAGRDPSQESIRRRPRRIANRFARSPYYSDIGLFYSDELGVDPSTFSLQRLKKLSPEQRLQLVQTTARKFADLIREGRISPDAFIRSCSKLPPIGKFDRKTDEPISGLQEFQRMEEPFFVPTLDQYVPKDYFSGAVPSVLSLACGLDTEAAAIHRHFSPDEDKAGVHVGIDLDDKNIKDAKKLYKGNPDYAFLHGDLDSGLVREELGQIQPEFDMVVMRHFPVLPAGDLWQRTLTNYRSFIRQGGLVLMTLYYPEEFDIVRNAGFGEGYNIEVAERNRARTFNKRQFNRAMIYSTFETMAAAFSDMEPTNQFADVVDNTFRQDQFVVIATKK